MPFPGNTCWLSDDNLLPKYLPSARILTWGYNSKLASLKGEETSSNSILHHAQNLVAELYADRRVRIAAENIRYIPLTAAFKLDGDINRPIIFLCHSLGGIVVKRPLTALPFRYSLIRMIKALAYSESRKGSKLSHLNTIFTSTYGILFFGTPHNGSSKASLLNSLQKLVAVTVPQRVFKSERSLSKALKEESETLENVTDQFTPLMPNFRIFFFWEQQAMDLKYTRDYIVREASAAPLLENTERAGIAADHRELCRFETDTSPGFRTVIEALQRYSRDAPAVVQGRVSQARQVDEYQRGVEAQGIRGAIVAG
ncbi:MAG: hypothetical protein M1814_006217 [Vezdaea aestivalis]|nr:MAG: hypothetical protein M1814_006217 [Vezdaea aestivalis]